MAYAEKLRREVNNHQSHAKVLYIQVQECENFHDRFRG